MTKNTKGGTGHKKLKNKTAIKTRKLVDIAKDFDPTEFEVYGIVQKATGNRRFSVVCQTHTNPKIVDTLICSIKGSYRRRICKDMPVLVKLYDFNIMQGQIIDSYTDDELKMLKDADLWDFPENYTVVASDVADRTLEMSLGSDSESDSDSESKPDSEPEAKTETPNPSTSATIEPNDDFDIDAI